MLAASLTAGCRRVSPAPRSAGGEAKLEAPAPSSVTLAGLLSIVSTGYDNVQQAHYLQEESKRMGISNLDKPSGRTGESGEASDDLLSYEEGIERTKILTKQFSAQRRAIDKGRPKPIGLEGTTPDIIPSKPQGRPIEDAPVLLDSVGRPRL